LKIQWNPTGNSVKFHWKPVKNYWKTVKNYWKTVKFHSMTRATALQFPVASGSLELAKRAVGSHWKFSEIPLESSENSQETG